MGVIVARAEAISSRDPALAWAAINYYNVYDYDTRMMGNLDDEDQWVENRRQLLPEKTVEDDSKRGMVSNTQIIVGDMKVDLAQITAEGYPNMISTYTEVGPNQITPSHFKQLEDWLLTKELIKPENRRSANDEIWKTAIDPDSESDNLAPENRISGYGGGG